MSTRRKGTMTSLDDKDDVFITNQPRILYATRKLCCGNLMFAFIFDRSIKFTWLSDKKKIKNWA